MKKYFIFILTILLTFLSINAMAETNYLTILTFGEYGNRAGEFNYPAGIAIDRDNNLYITSPTLIRPRKPDWPGGIRLGAG